ncbi:MAG: helix-turn-helix domain-containing protein [Bacilli bacterium]|nr:helix-turn-helix domain-containing protein [Bacilli bacterium]MDD4607840.1 helix-turn-helix domain-containing protein [Bacilli bacterium]
MKEIGEKLKEARDSIGITVEEVAEDLKMRPSQIESIEEGNIESFKDIFYLKYFIRDYAKYLGLPYEEMVDEFNEYLFDYTSKISLEDIKKAKKKSKEKNAEPVKKIASPYTLTNNKKINIPSFIIYVFIVLLLIIIGYFIVQLASSDDFIEEKFSMVNM